MTNVAINGNIHTIPVNIYPRKEDFVYHVGRVYTVEWYYTISGRMPGVEHYQNLSVPDRARFLQIVKHFCDSPHGTIFPKTLYNIEDHENKIYAFKPNAERFFNFMTVGAKIIVTNAYHKQSQRMRKIDLEGLKVAARYRQDYLTRIKEGTYYEKD